MIKNFIWSILINTAVLVIIALWIPFGWLHITPISWNMAPVLLLMGLIFWVIYQVARPILKFLTTPINWITLGIAGVLLNMLALYVFAYVINTLGLGLQVQLGSIEQTFILSIIVTILTLVLKKVL
jgi:putative membrane protein